MLLQHPTRIVTREEIRRKLWPNDTIVEFDHSINAAIRRLREALNDSADDPQFIETLARRGYRFKLTVESARAAERPDPAAPSPASNAQRVPSPSAVPDYEDLIEIRII